MRISAQECDPGYANWLAILAESKRASITVDGVKVDNVMIADTDLGVVFAYAEPLAEVVHPSGKISGVAMIRFTGKVEISEYEISMREINGA